MRFKGDLVLLLVAILWGSAFAAQRVAGQLGNVYFFNGTRFMLAALFLFPFTLRTSVPLGQWIWMSAAGCILFVASALQQAGLLTTSAGNAGFITSLYVVLVPFVLWLGWKETPRWSAVLAVMLATAGAYLLSAAGKFEMRRGDAFEFGGAAFWALHVVLLGKFAYKFEAISFSAGQLFIGGILNLLASVALERLEMTAAAHLIGPIVYTAVASLGLGYTLQIWGQRHTPPTDAAIILSLESVFAVLAGWVFLRERLAPIQVLGGILILCGVFLSQAGRWGRIEVPLSSHEDQ